MTTNPHIAEERGLVVDDSGVNEEDKSVFYASSSYRILILIHANVDTGPLFAGQMLTSLPVLANKVQALSYLLHPQSIQLRRSKKSRIFPRYLSMLLMGLRNPQLLMVPSRCDRQEIQIGQR